MKEQLIEMLRKGVYQNDEILKFNDQDLKINQILINQNEIMIALTFLLSQN